MQDALNLIAAKKTELDRTHLNAGGTLPLHLEPWEFERRCQEMRARLELLAADGPSMPLLLALGAHVVSAVQWLDGVELADPTSGEAA